MKGVLKNVTGTEGGAMPCLLVNCSDGSQYSILRMYGVIRSAFRRATILIAEDGPNVYGIAKVTAFNESNEAKTIERIAGKEFTLKDLKEIKDCR